MHRLEKVQLRSCGFFKRKETAANSFSNEGFAQYLQALRLFIRGTSLVFHRQYYCQWLFVML